MGRLRIGVDLGGTKIEAIALDTSGKALQRERVTTPRGDYVATVAAVAELVLGLEKRLGVRASVGVGTPGAISRPDGLLRNSNSVCLNGKPLQRDLQQALEREIRIANDADCFALSEASDGAGAGAASVFGVIVGTGTGGGIVVNGTLLSGANGIAGEWGHNPLPWPREGERPGADCYCGRQGCVETWLSGPALEREYRRVTGVAASAAEIGKRDLSGEPAAGQALEAYAERMARALATVMNVVDPACIVLGGGLGNIERLYRDVPRHWGRYVFSNSVCTALLKPKFGDSSGVRGAAWLWPAE